MNRTVVLGHTRLSWGEQDSNSPRRQADAIRAWAHQEQFAHLELYQDVEGRHSGRSNEGRPEWARLLHRLATDPAVAVVVVESIDRLFRNLKLLQHFVDDCVARGVRFVSIAENFDFKPPSQADNPLEEAMRRLALQQFGALAEAWSNMTSAKMKMKVRAWQAEGKYWGIEPFGTKRDAANRLAPDSATSYHWHAAHGLLTDAADGAQPRSWHMALTRCYTLYAQGYEGWGGVADTLNREGYPYKDRRGRPRLWRPDDVRRALNTHLTYRGHLTAERSDTSRAPRILLADAWDPILPLPLIDRACEVLKRRRRTGAYTGKKSTYALTPLLACHVCKRPLSGQTTAYGVRNYRHSGRCDAPVKQINAARIEAELNRLIQDVLLPPSSWDALDAVLEAIAREDGPGAERERLSALTVQRDNLRRAFVEQQQYGVQVLSWGELAARLAPLDAEIAAIRERVAATSAPVSVRVLLQRLHNVAGIIEKSGVETRRELYAGLFERVEVDLAAGEIAVWNAAPWLNAYIQVLKRCSKMRIEGLHRANHAAFIRRLATIAA